MLNVKTNVEIISLICKSVPFLDMIAEELKGPHCQSPGWDVGIRIVANDAYPAVLKHLPEVGVPYTLYNNEDPNEHYVPRAQRCYNFAGMTSEYDNVCFVNSDMIFSQDWLANLLRWHDGINIPAPRLVESGRCPPFTHILTQNFGMTPESIDKSGFRLFAEGVKVPNTVLLEGALMPIVLTKQRLVESGGYNGALGDLEFVQRLESQFGMRHITVCDSVVYHVTMGETVLP